MDTEEGKCETFLSIINLGEVAYVVEREQGLRAAHLALAALEQLPISILEADRAAVLAAAHIKAHHPVSYADAFAAAVAQAYDAVLLTGHPEFESVKDLVKVEFLSAN